MQVLLILLPFVLAGVAVLFIAFSGGPGAAREAYLTRGGALFRVVIPLIYIGFGIVVPAVVIASREDHTGGTPQLRDELPDESVERGKQLFRQTCASCHSLAAANAHGVTGPNLDNIGAVTPKRVKEAIRIGGTGQKRMPAGLLRGRDAQDVADYVAATAGK
jgi:cytochrome c553